MLGHQNPTALTSVAEEEGSTEMTTSTVRDGRALFSDIHAGYAPIVRIFLVPAHYDPIETEQPLVADPAHVPITPELTPIVLNSPPDSLGTEQSLVEDSIHRTATTVAAAEISPSEQFYDVPSELLYLPIVPRLVNPSVGARAQVQFHGTRVGSGAFTAVGGNQFIGSPSTAIHSPRTPGHPPATQLSPTVFEEAIVRFTESTIGSGAFAAIGGDSNIY